MSEDEQRGAANTVAVLYYDADRDAQSRLENHDVWKDVTVDTVADSTVAQQKLDEGDYAALVVEPASLTRDDEPFVATITDPDCDSPVVLYTELAASELDETLLSGTTTVVEKGSMPETLRFLRQKVNAVASRPSTGDLEMLDSYEVLADAARDGIYVLGADGCFRYANQSMAELVGYDQEDLVGMHASQIMAPGELERGQALIQEMVTAGESESDVFDMQYQTKGGDRFIVGLSFSLLYDDGTYAGMVAVARDVSERREREAELERQNERLENFTSIVSHDLRNPLNVAHGRIVLAQEDCKSDDLDVAADAVDRAFALIDDLLALAREGKVASDVEPVDIEEIVRDCWVNVETGEMPLVVETEQTIRADPSRLKQLLENLFRNAVVHGGEDVTVTVGSLDDGFYIADDGPGIPEDEREQVLDVGYSTTEDGTGFGLNIVAEIAEAHGWSVDVTEHDGGGARFEFTGVDIHE